MTHTINSQRKQFQLEDRAFDNLIDRSNLTEEWCLIATATRRYRGVFKNNVGYVHYLEIIQDRDNDLIRRDMLGDRDASESDEDGNVRYSRIGKTSGLKTYAILSRFASDEAIEEFYYLLKELGCGMLSVKNDISTKYGIDFLQEL